MYRADLKIQIPSPRPSPRFGGESEFLYFGAVPNCEPVDRIGAGVFFSFFISA
jgi:hypothetical protein